MSHDHHHGHHHHAATSNLKLAFFLNFGFTIIEFIGGILTNSTAILADAVHDLGDSFALAQAWYFETLSQKHPSRSYTYGYKRFSLLGATISALLLLASSLYVLGEAIPRIIEPEHSDAQGMVLLAIFGIAVNGFAMMRLAKGNSANMRVVAMHLLEDVLGWASILVVAIILMFTDLHILDPILACLIALYILSNVVKQLKTIVPVFLQASPDGFDPAEMEQKIAALPGVESVHHLHLWSLDDDHVVLSVHVVTAQVLSSDEYRQLKQQFKNLMEDSHIDHSTLEIEWPDEPCRIASSLRGGDHADDHQHPQARTVSD